MEVSIIIPVYNAAPFVEKAVRSALMQKEVKELLAIDDGSTDGSWEILQGLAEENSRLRLFRHPGGVNKGPGASRNIGLKNARCTYVAFLDADDFYVENRFEKTKDVFQQHPDADGVYETMEMFYYSEGARKKFQELYPGFHRFSLSPPENPVHLFDHLLSNQHGSVSICGLTVKREFIEKGSISFLEEARMWEDVNFYLSAFLNGIFYPGSIETPVVRRGVHLSNTSYNKRLDFCSAIYFQQVWFGKIFEKKFRKSTNWKFFKMKLHYNWAVFPIREIIWLRYCVKAVLFILYLFCYPKLFVKLFAKE